ncbi:MAG: YfhO family protein, partial [Oscillospiraceae bacterium]|nr:YfhO family protein [Oscillospiraceae bacterium]
HVPNMLPYRFSFLFSFTLLIIAYRAYTILIEEKLSFVQWGAMLVVGGIFIGLAATSGIKDDNEEFVKASVIIGAIYLVIVFLRLFTPKQAVNFLLAVAVIGEMGIQGYRGVKAVGSSTYSSYPSKQEEINGLLAIRDQREDELFARTEITQWYTLNDPALYDYNGLSQFSSMANESVTTFMRCLGVAAGEAGNRYFYANNTPVLNLLCDIKYIIAKDGYNADTVNAKKIGEYGNTAIWQEEQNLGLGFLVDFTSEFYIMDDSINAFEQQNAIFRKITGLSEDVFTPIDITHVGHVGYDVTRREYGQYNFSRQADAPEDNSFLKYNYTAVQDGMLYALVKVSDADNIDIWYDNAIVHTYNVSRQPYTFPLGEYHADDMVTVKVQMKSDNTSGTAQVYVYQLNQEVLEEGYNILNQGRLHLTEFEDTHFKGTVNAAKDQTLYMSVPYEKGWTCYVDGQKARLYPIFDAMCGVNLSEGEHEIEMRYSPRGFRAGVCIAVVSLAALIVLYIIERRMRGKAAFDKEEKTESTPSPTVQEA